MKQILTLASLLAASNLALAQSNYPTFRGEKRDGHSSETGLLKQWPEGGPKLAWKAKGLGLGYAGIAAWGDKLYTLGDSDNATNLLCLSAADGKPLWKVKVGGELKEETAQIKNKDKSWWQNRATPTTDGKIVIALAPMGELLVADAASGKTIWKKNLKSDFGGEVGKWDYSDSPLIDGDLIICVPGGSQGAVLALNKATGAKVWQSKEFTEAAEYACVVPVEIGGIPQYIAYTMNFAAGIAAKDGKLLWKAPRPEGKVAVIPTPIYKDGVLFTCSGYGVGHNGFRIASSGGKFSVSEIYKGREMENHHGGVILVGDHLYGVDQKGNLICMELKTGKIAWQAKTSGKGSIAFADGMLVVRAEDKKTGAVALVEASPEGYKEKGRFTQPDLSGWPVWAHPTIAGGKLYLRDQDVLLAYTIK